MIRLLMLGQVGNQMFQYAVGRHLAIKHKTELLIDLSFLGLKWGEGYIARYKLPELGVTTRVIHPSPEIIASDSESLLKVNLPEGVTKYRERRQSFDEKVLSLPSDSLLRGYFQSEKYFFDIRDVVRADYKLQNIPKTPETEAVIDSIANSDSVSVHVRRGDYLEMPFFNVCTLNYFNKAIDFLKARLVEPRFYFFSDDIEWCRNNFKDPSFMFVDVPQSQDQPLNDMRLMSLCKHNIIANSSFSWWGSWLNNNLSKMVVAPSVWFNRDDIPIADKICDGWVLISPN